MTTLPTDRTIRNRRFAGGTERAFKPDHYHREKFTGHIQPCLELPVKGASLLEDGGFENYVSDTGRTDFARRGFTPFPSLRWMDDTPAEPWVGGGKLGLNWFERESNTEWEDEWTVSTANPRTGTYHARAVNLAGPDHTSNSLSTGKYWVCDFDGTTGMPIWFVEPGYVMSATCYAMVTASMIGGGSNQLILMSINYYDIDYMFMSQASNSPNNLSGSYQQFSVSAVAPVGAVYGEFTMIDSQSSISVASTYDVDDVTLSIL